MSFISNLKIIKEQAVWLFDIVHILDYLDYFPFWHILTYASYLNHLFLSLGYFIPDIA